MSDQAFVYMRSAPVRLVRYWFKIQHDVARVTPLYISLYAGNKQVLDEPT